MICGYCKKEFEPKRAGTRFCSDRCRVYAKRNNKAVTDNSISVTKSVTSVTDKRNNVTEKSISVTESVTDNVTENVSVTGPVTENVTHSKTEIEKLKEDIQTFRDSLNEIEDRLSRLEGVVENILESQEVYHTRHISGTPYKSQKRRPQDLEDLPFSKSRQARGFLK